MYLYKMKRIETRDNEFLMQLRNMFRDSFPRVLKFKVDYYLGEDKGVTGLYFILTSKFGRLFAKTKPLMSGQTVYDVEDEFMNEVINDLVMNGIIFANILAFESIDYNKVNNDIQEKDFKNTIPRKLIFAN